MQSRSQTEQDDTTESQVDDIRVVGISDVVDKVSDRPGSTDDTAKSLAVVGVHDIAGDIN